MTGDLPSQVRDQRHLDPEVRKERVKMLANGANAVGLALLIGALVAPVVDAGHEFVIWRTVVGCGLAAGSLVAAQVILRYMKRKETL